MRRVWLRILLPILPLAPPHGPCAENGQSNATAVAAAGGAGSRTAASTEQTTPSYDWRELKFICPIAMDPAVRPIYANNVPLRWAGNFVALNSLERRQNRQRSVDFMGHEGGHNGIDYGTSYRSLNDNGARVVAAAGGTLLVLRDGQNDHLGGTTQPEGFVNWRVHARKEDGSDHDGSGNCVYLRHPNGFVTQYAHLKRGVRDVLKGCKIGDWIPQGALLGYAASSGASSGPHLHFGVYSSLRGLKARPDLFHPLERQDTGITRFGRAAGEYGVYVDPCFKDPQTGETMWQDESQAPYYKGDGPMKFFDLAVSAVEVRRINPASDIERAPVGATIFVQSYIRGRHGEARLELLRPGASAPEALAMDDGVSTFTAAAAGRYEIRALERHAGEQQWRLIHAQPLVAFRADRTMTFTAAPRGDFGGAFVETREHLATWELSDRAALTLGDDAQNRQRKALIVFDTSGLPQGAAAQYAMVELKTKAAQGLNPLRNPWAGRLYVDLAAAPIDANAKDAAAGVAWSAAQLNGAREPGHWTRAVIEPRGLAQIGAAGAVYAQLRFQVGTNDNLQADEIQFHYDAQDMESNPRLTVYY